MNFAPLIVTAKLDPKSFDTLDRLRHAYFPPERNFLAAHVTLFHHLPGAEIPRITADLDKTCSMRERMPVAFPSLRFLGRGVAVDVDSPGLLLLRRELAEIWADDLNAQDRQKFRPHVTIQNKVDEAQARKLFDELNPSFKIPDGTLTGLALWHYEGGPWRAEREFPFSARP